MKHPRQAELARLIAAIERVRPIAAIEVRWDNEVPVWRIELVGAPKPVGQEVAW